MLRTHEDECSSALFLWMGQIRRKKGNEIVDTQDNDDRFSRCVLQLPCFSVVKCDACLLSEKLWEVIRILLTFLKLLSYH